jgi:hypothetical protein
MMYALAAGGSCRRLALASCHRSSSQASRSCRLAGTERQGANLGALAPIVGCAVHALVSWWQLPENHANRSLPELEPLIVALVRRAPGFIDGYWTFERVNCKSVGFTLLDTAEHAHDLRNAIESHVDSREQATVQLEMIRVQEIVAHMLPCLA